MKRKHWIAFLIFCFLIGIVGTGYAADNNRVVPAWEQILFEEKGANYFSPIQIQTDHRQKPVLIYSRLSGSSFRNIIYSFDASGKMLSHDEWIENQGEQLTNGYIPTSDGGFMRRRSAGDDFIDKVDRDLRIEFSVSLQKDLGLPKTGPAVSSILHDFAEVEDGYLFVGAAAGSKAINHLDAWSVDFWMVKIGLDGRVLWEKVFGNENGTLQFAYKMPNNQVLLAGLTGQERCLLIVDKDGNILQEKRIDAKSKFVNNVRFGTSDNFISTTTDGGFVLLTETFEEANYTSGSTTYIRSNTIYQITKYDGTLNQSWQATFYGENHHDYTSYPYKKDIKGIVSLKNGNTLVYGAYKARDKWMLSRFDPNENYQGYIMLLDANGKQIKDLLVSSDRNQNYVFTDISEINNELIFLGYRYETSAANDYTWLGKLELDMKQPAVMDSLPSKNTIQDIKIDIFIDGQKQDFADRPVMIQGRTLLPMRVLFQALGADVDWDQGTNTAIGFRDGIEICIPIGSSSPTVNSKATKIDVPAQLINGRTYIPLRFVGEALGDEVKWYGEIHSVKITKKSR